MSPYREPRNPYGHACRCGYMGELVYFKILPGGMDTSPRCKMCYTKWAGYCIEYYNTITCNHPSTYEEKEDFTNKLKEKHRLSDAKPSFWQRFKKILSTTI